MIGSSWLSSSLVCHANAFLNGLEDAPPTDLPGLEFVKRLTFRDVASDEVFADSSTKWFEHLRSQRFDCATVYFNVQKTDVNLLAFAGAMRVAVLTEGSGGRIAWYAKEEVLDLKDPDRKIWDVAFKGFDYREEPPGIVATIDEGRLALKKSLQDLVAFCSEQSLENWGSNFQASLDKFDDPDPGFDWGSRVFPPKGYSDLAKALFFAASSSWVFGGMGSWNDMGFEGPIQAEYESLSDQHYNAILMAIYASTAAFELN